MNRVLSHSVDAFTGGICTRRQFMRDLIAVPAFISLAPYARASDASSEEKKNKDVAYGQTTLPVGIRSRFIHNVNGLTIHILEAGFETKDRPLVLLLHGFLLEGTSSFCLSFDCKLAAREAIFLLEGFETPHIAFLFF